MASHVIVLCVLAALLVRSSCSASLLPVCCWGSCVFCFSGEGMSLFLA